MDDSCFNLQWPETSFDDLNSMSIEAAFGDNIMTNEPSLVELKPSERPMKQCKTNSVNSSCTTTTDHIPFANSSDPNQVSVATPKEETLSSKSPSDASAFQGQSGNENYASKSSRGAKRTCTSNMHRQAQDHIIAERNRREKLSQRFIALSALVPGLKKMDKASVLGGAIKYLKQLQERVKTLEEQTKKRTTESVGFVKKYEVSSDGENSASDEESSGEPVHKKLLEIEARFSEKDVLIRIHCEKRTGVMEKTLAKIEKLHLSVINSTAMTFATYSLDITVTAQMDKEFSMTMKDLVKNLHLALKQFM